ncbi:Histidyl-tRNA synthetase, partial [Candidatus Kryptonium thompsonii]
MLDSKDERDKTVIENAPLIYEYLCDDCEVHFNELKKILDTIGIKYELEPHLVRGLDYYTKTAFEVISPELGSQD